MLSDPTKNSAVVHIGHQTHTAITLQALSSNPNQAQNAPKGGVDATTGAAPMQKLIVLAGKSVANTPAGADQSRLDEANFDIATVGGNQMISTGRLDEIDKV